MGKEEKSADERRQGQVALKGKSAVITGASRGIGRATAIALAKQGMSLVLVARPSEDLDHLSALLEKAATTIVADLSDAGEVAKATDMIDARIGTPDILVNNAGAFYVDAFEKLAPDDFQRSLAVNLMAPFLLARAFLPAMRARRSGHIVTIGSIADRHIFPENVAYASTKHGLRAMHEVMRAETKGSGIRTTLISPGPVDTRLWDPINPDKREGYTPRDAMLDPISVADAILFVVTRAPHVNIDELRLGRS